METKKKYKNTLNLPKTNFPMRANLTQKEVATLAHWEKEKLYARIQNSRVNREKYILHDGPPYANGHLHIGHALNKILKDIIVKAKTMSGYAAPYVPGWDCHGLPIEHQVLKALGGKKREMSKVQIRQRCRDYADKYVKIQREEFKRLGVFGDWDHPYLTMTADYEAAIVREFGKVVASGAVYRAKKPVLWCSYDETALAEAEVEHAEHVSPSIYVKFRVVADPAKVFGPELKNVSLVIWTTTPWTLVANQAVCLHPDFEYQAVRVNVGENCEQTWIIAKDLVAQCMKEFEIQEYTVEEKIYKGRELRGVTCCSPFLEDGSGRTWPSEVITGAHVTLEQGSGCVHTAPGHGQEDYEVGLENGLEVFAPLDHRGRFTDEIDQGIKQWEGLEVLKANEAIISRLSEIGTLVKAGSITHSYPHCWRCKKPVIFRATKQWFISMGDEREDVTKSLRGRAVEAICEINNNKGWIPSWGYDRMLGMVNNRPDWCISRQRIWGVPIIAFTCLGCEESLPESMIPEIANHIAGLMEKEGSDIWFSKSAADLLPNGTVCPNCSGSEFQQENDILDVWFESGISHIAVLEHRKLLPEGDLRADLYLEGTDQHRGWFQSSLLTTLVADPRQKSAPYKAVLTHGFTVDGSGKKMSKSVGNVVAPEEVIKKYGAEILRLWVAATDFREDVRISPDILTQLAEAYRKIRNTCRFLLGNLYDYHPGSAPFPEADLQDIDRWALRRLQVLNKKVQWAYHESEFHIVFHALNNFCSVDLSSFYLDILKDRLYTAGADSPERRAAQAVMQEILRALVRLMAPILSFTADEIWQYLPEDLKTESSVHLTEFPELKDLSTIEAGDEEKDWSRLIRVRDEVARVLEEARKDKKIGNPLEARVHLFAKPALYDLLKGQRTMLPAFFIVSQVDLSPWQDQEPPVQENGDADQGGSKWTLSTTVDQEGLRIEVTTARGEKCGRCWTYQESVGRDEVHPTLCRRCTEVVLASGINTG
ncbi:MAG: isoleucine--tRNA ligase [Nitrospira sp.]|nr:isoleucine--tRNA ligase [Candidatus Manganitrophaceae bacterium]HIL34267.1 isoleucine--tRNA ligase [Candidatus Manganitrophaceae bacterium]